MIRWLLVLVVAMGCQGRPAQPAPVSPRGWMISRGLGGHDDARWIDDEPLGPDLNLSSGDAADSTINKLLTYRLELPATVTVGILHLPGTRARRSWLSSPDVSELTQALAESVVAALSRAPRIVRAAVLPALAVGDQYTVASLREAAARLQAHVLMVYRPSCRFYERVPFVGSRHYRAVCTIEAVVLDTRSGIVPFSKVITGEAITQRERDDFDREDTWRRVHLQALVNAATDLSGRVGAFLGTVPQRGG